MSNGKKGGPKSIPPKDIKLKACGAEQDDEECPTQDEPLPWSKTNEGKDMQLLESYLDFLYTDDRSQAKEWQGTNKPYGDDSNRPNLIRKCFTLESNRMKINCLRKLRDQAAMNPFYQARLDRFVDAITQTYEPTDKPGTIPGNEFKTGHVGDDL